MRPPSFGLRFHISGFEVAANGHFMQTGYTVKHPKIVGRVWQQVSEEVDYKTIRESLQLLLFCVLPLRSHSGCRSEAVGSC